jgi:N-acetyltransferase
MGFFLLCTIFKNQFQMPLPYNYFNLCLQDENILLKPLQIEDFERLYAVACDPLIWEQHPNKNRYEKEVFGTFFEGAMASKGAFMVLEKNNNQVIGSTRFYDYDPVQKSVFIGYTFIARKYWGKSINKAIKHMMLYHAFAYCDQVLFHIGEHNTRSQIAMERLGGKKTKTIEVTYYGEAPKINIEYAIEKGDFLSEQSQSIIS